MSRRARGFLLALVLMLMPIALVMMITLSGQLMHESGQTLLNLRRSKAFYLCEAGLNAGFELFASNNFQGHTHESDGVTTTSTGSPTFLNLYGFPAHSLDGQGWYRWEWLPGQPLADSFTRSGQPESYRFKVYFPTATTWKMVCEATVDGQISRQEVGGVIESPLGYSIFDNGDCNDLTLAENVHLKGSIHANGNLHLRPWKTDGLVVPVLGIEIVKPCNADYLLECDSITAAGRIIRFEDALGEADPGGTLTLANAAKGLSPTRMEGLSDGPGWSGKTKAYDSYHPTWRSTAASRYSNIVADSELGSKTRSLPREDAFRAGGFYDTRAGLHIDASTSGAWVTTKKFYNQAENREVQVKEVDVSKLLDPSVYPTNGVIYSSVPIRLVNGAKIDKRLTLASASTIYTQGDFNKDNPDGSGANQRQSVALMTTDRVYQLTKDFNDTKSYTYEDPSNVVSPPHKASDPPAHPSDPADVLEVNCAIVDGSPTNDARVWVKDPANPYYVPGYFMNPFTGKSTGTKPIPSSHDAQPGLKVAYPNGDDYLENLQGMKLKYLGSRVHMRTAKMSKTFDNADCAGDPTVTPWLIKSAFIPPQDRAYEPDPRLSDSNPLVAPPLALRGARRLFWRPLP